VPVTIEACERPIMFELTQTADLSRWQGDGADRAWLAFLDDVRGFVGRERAALAPMPSLATVASKSDPARETLIAVLPFDNLSSDSEMDFFCDGVSEDIMGRIIRASKLQVVGRTSSFQFRGADKSRAAAALAASHVLDGSIRRAGNRVRITAQLTAADGNRTIWADKFDRDLSDIFAVQDEISEAIADALDIAFFPVATSKIDPVAYDLYLRGKTYEPNPQALLRKIELLQAAVQIAPHFADAWAALAFAQTLIFVETPWRERSAIKAKAEACIRRTLELDPDNSVAVLAQASLLAPFSDFLALERAIERLEHVGQNSPDILASLGYNYSWLGRIRDAAALAQRAAELDPLNRLARMNAPIFRWQSGDYEAGLAALTAANEQDPDNQHVAVVLILAHAHARDWSAVDRLTDSARLAQYPLREYSDALGLVLAMRGTNSEIRQQMLQAVTMAAEQSGHIDAAFLLWMAELGFVEEAFALLERCRLDPSGGPSDRLGTTAYRTHNLFSAAHGRLRADPRFVKLCARLGLVEYWLATQKWPDCADTVPYDFRAECEKYRDFPKDVFLA
jgi:TolB-like protein/Flp pilus assembly protein TadD